MSGHSKFANIAHKKAANDAAKGKIFTRLGKEASGNIQKAAGQGEDLAGFALFSVCPGRIDHKSEIYDHAQQQDSAFNAA